MHSDETDTPAGGNSPETKEGHPEAVKKPENGKTHPVDTQVQEEAAEERTENRGYS